jgi:predicted NACHT family NTPase
MELFNLSSELLSNHPEIWEWAAKGMAMTFGKVLGETVINTAKTGGEKIIDGTSQLAQSTQDLFFKVAKKYVENYANRHATFKVLGMAKPVTLDDIYIKVNFEHNRIPKYQTLDDQEQLFRQRDLRDQEGKDGMKIANQEPYLMVLGHPGTGKSTFLRKVGLEALKWQKGDYDHPLIPVLLELRRFSKKETYNLIEEIAKEFNHCGLSDYQKNTEKLLDDGKLLILLDGLDEVPTERLSEMNTAIRNLLDRYDKNRFIVSCRIAAYHNFASFQRFSDVVIAYFDDKQIELFINKWFASHNQPEWGQQCWQKLKSSDHQATEELTRTPLLLTLLCILFKNKGEFPNERATLYERAIATLLDEWDASKEISRSAPYKGLDTKRKEILLAEIAYQNFIKDNLFFQQGEIAQEIEIILKEISKEDQLINGKAILKTIEEQHGILIDRGDNTYSFSHLTLQEFLTAKQIIDNDDQIDLKNIVNDHLFDDRWREVFLILAGLKKADNLLKLMKQKTDSLINDCVKLKDLLTWAENIVDPSDGEITLVGKRSIAIAYALALANALANAEAYDIANAYALAEALADLISYLQWSQQSQIYQGVNLTPLIDSLQQLKAEISDDNQSDQSIISDQKFQQILEELLSAFHLTPDLLSFSASELHQISNYLKANYLILQCKESAVRCTPQTWQEIEGEMLLPLNNLT